MGQSFLSSVLSLDVYSITSLVDSHVCGQRKNSMVSKRPREYIKGTSPLSLYVGNFGKWPEDGRSGQKARAIFQFTDLFFCNVESAINSSIFFNSGIVI